MVMVTVDEINEELKSWHQMKIDQLDLLYQHADKKIQISPDNTIKLESEQEIKAFRLAVLLSKHIFERVPEI